LIIWTSAQLWGTWDMASSPWTPVFCPPNSDTQIRSSERWLETEIDSNNMNTEELLCLSKSWKPIIYSWKNTGNFRKFFHWSSMQIFPELLPPFIPYCIAYSPRHSPGSLIPPTAQSCYSSSISPL
jgi:hypothetical protein